MEYIALTLIYILLMAFVIYKARGTTEDFLIASRALPTLQIVASKFANAVGAGFLITYTAFAYTYGINMMLFIGGYILGYIVFAFWAAPRIYTEGRKHQLLTMGGFVENCVNSKFARTLVQLVVIAALGLFAITGIIGGSKAIMHFVDISYTASVLFMLLFTGLYVMSSGFKGIVFTDILQALLILILLTATVFGLFNIDAPFSWLENTENIYKEMDIPLAIGLAIYGLFSTFASADRYQLSFAANSKKQLVNGMAFSVIPVVIIAFSLLIIGMVSKQTFPTLDPDLAFFTMMKNGISESFAPIILIMIFAAVMSSIDTNFYVIASHLTRMEKKENESHTALQKRMRYVMFTILAALAVLCIFLQDVTDAAVLAVSILITLAVPMIYLVAGGRNKRIFTVSLIVGLLGCVTGLMILGIKPTVMLLDIAGGLLGMCTGFIINKCIKKKD